MKELVTLIKHKEFAKAKTTSEEGSADRAADQRDGLFP